MNSVRMNSIMDQAHAALRDLERNFTALEAHFLIAKVANLDLETAAGIFAIMRILQYICDIDESLKEENPSLFCVSTPKESEHLDAFKKPL